MNSQKNDTNFDYRLGPPKFQVANEPGQIPFMAVVVTIVVIAMGLYSINDSRRGVEALGAGKTVTVEVPQTAFSEIAKTLLAAVGK
jgi:hypothetical protein